MKEREREKKKKFSWLIALYQEG